jgi:hypothetical protein
LVHIEAQSDAEADFTRRMFFYFARLHQKHLRRIYPIVIFSFDQPYRAEPYTYTVAFPERKILEFNFEAIQLNRLDWQDFLAHPNPVAAALMSKMRIAPEDRPRVKAECLRLLALLGLNPARTKLVSGFVDTYLRLNEGEEAAFRAELGRIEPAQREGVMEIVTSWMEQGIEQGIERERSLILRQLHRRIGALPEPLQEQVTALAIDQLEALGEALLDFSSLADLEHWLAEP